MTPEDKLAAYERVIAQCQAILARHLQPQGPTEKDTITALLEILDGPETLDVQRKPLTKS